MRSKLYFLTIFIAQVAFGQVQKLAPMELAEKFMAHEKFPDVMNYLCCELTDNPFDSTYAGWPAEILEEAKKYKPDFSKKTLGEQLPKNFKRTFELVFQDSSSAVVSVEVSDKRSQCDYYLNFRNNDGWKLSAIRGLALTGFMTSYLAKESDRNIISYFLKNENKFNELLSEARVNLKSDKVKALEKEVQIIEVNLERTICLDCFQFVIDGMVDNYVGYLYVEDEKNLPPIDGDKYIVIKKIKNGWYLFKTT